LLQAGEAGELSRARLTASYRRIRALQASP